MSPHLYRAVVQVLETDPGPTASRDELAQWLVSVHRELVGTTGGPVAFVDRTQYLRYTAYPTYILRRCRASVTRFALNNLRPIVASASRDLAEHGPDWWDEETTAWFWRACAALERARAVRAPVT